MLTITKRGPNGKTTYTIEDRVIVAARCVDGPDTTVASGSLECYEWFDLDCPNGDPRVEPWGDAMRGAE